MTPELAARFAALPRLDRSHRMTAAIPCKICRGPAPFFDVNDFGIVDVYGPTGIIVPWHRCPACGFLFTPLCDDWSSDDFRRFIYNDDHLLADGDYLEIRPRNTAAMMAHLLADHRDMRILDYGSGIGLFARLMHESGFHRMEAYDPYSMPARPAGPFDIITCIETIEHSPTPVETLDDMRSLLADDGIILLGEVLQPANIDVIKCSWWYCGTRNGHVSTFADRTIVELCRPAGLIFHPAATGPHALRRGSRFLGLARRQGPALTYFRLGAPRSGAASAFHGVEDIPGWEFRWTITDTIRWHVTVPPEAERVQILIPFCNQSRAGFAAECHIGLGDTLAVATIRESSLFAEFDAPMAGPVMVSLGTPPLREGANGAKGVGIGLRVLD